MKFCKFPLAVVFKQTVLIPSDGRVLTVQTMSSGDPFLFALGTVLPGDPGKQVTVSIYGEADLYAVGDYLATFQYQGAAYHAFTE